MNRRVRSGAGNGGLNGIVAETDTGLITIAANAAVTATGGNGIYAEAFLAGGAIDIDTAVGATVTGTGGFGIDTTTVNGLTTITTNGNVVGDLGGINANSTTGVIDIETNGTVNSSAGTG
eukprot:gene32608-43567_t